MAGLPGPPQSIRSRNIQKALDLIASELEKASEREFKEILLQRRFALSKLLNLKREARDAATKMLEIEPQNFYCSLARIDLLEERQERLNELEELRSQNPQSPVVLNEFAEELKAGVTSREKSLSSKSINNVVDLFKQSCKADPSIENPAWTKLCEIYTDQAFGYSKSKSDLHDLVEYHLQQDSRSVRTSSVLFRYCKFENTLTWNDRGLFDYLQESYSKHFPREIVAHLGVFADACIEFDQFGLLRKIFEEGCREVQPDEMDRFVSLLMRISYDVFRDRRQAIRFGENYLEYSKDSGVEQQLLWLYLHEGDTTKARELLKGLEGALSISRCLDLEAEILEREGNYQDAIDLLLTIPDKRDFEEKHGVKMTYLELIKGDFEAAFERARAFLDARSFSISFGSEIINYEFAKTQLKKRKKVDKARLTSLSELKRSEKAVQGVAYLLLGQRDKAFELFESEATKRFSWIDSFKRWPVMATMTAEIEELEERLVKAKRRFVLPDSHTARLGG